MKIIGKVVSGLAVFQFLCMQLVADQSHLEAVINSHDEVLHVDWPMIHIGTGEYQEGPTGVTVFHFQKKVLAAMDVLGGSPSSVNQSYMDLGYDYPELDAVVFAGGSWYGLEGVTAVSSALKEDRIRDGNAFGDEPNIALTLGSIIFDFGPRRLNEIYPDQRLAQAAFRAAKPGFFPQGAHGAGRMAKTGGFFGCNAHSGQGGAVRTAGELKVAAFTVVNAYGVVTNREGHVAACYPATGWPKNLRTSDLMTDFPASKDAQWKPEAALSGKRKSNTTVSLIVVNQKLTAVELKRLAVQVHASMSRAIQPFGTLYDGDVLYAVSTAELEQSELTTPELGVLASETMWDAVLASVPEQPRLAARNQVAKVESGDWHSYQGEYHFSDMAGLAIRFNQGKLFAQATGRVDVFGISQDSEVELKALSAGEFTVPGRYPLLVRFDGADQLVINPGRWEQKATRIPLSTRPDS